MSETATHITKNTHFTVYDFGSIMRMVDTVNTNLDTFLNPAQWLTTEQVCRKIGLTYRGKQNQSGRKILMAIKKLGYFKSTPANTRLFKASEVDEVMQLLNSGTINLNQIKKSIWK